MKPHAPQGFTLIELMVALAILGILVVLGVPNYRHWIANTHIRDAQESIQNGLREARTEAIKQNANFRFELTSAATADWQICGPFTAPPPPTPTPTCAVAGAAILDTFASASGSINVVLGASPTLGAYGTALSGGVPGGITFGPLGQILDYGASAIIRIDANTTQAGNRRLVTTVSPSGSVRMCDPALTLSAATPQGCS